MPMGQTYLIGGEGCTVGHCHQNPLQGVAILRMEQSNQTFGLIGSQNSETIKDIFNWCIVNFFHFRMA